MLAPWKKSYDQPRQQPRQPKKQRHYFSNKGPSSQSYGFSSSHIQMWELDYKESWLPKNWCFWTVVLEKTYWESLGLQGDQTIQFYRKLVLNIHWKDWCWSWISNNLATWCKELWVIGKDPNAGKDWRWEKKGMTEDEMVGWHHWINGHEFEQAPGVGEGQGSLACCSWARKDLDTTERLNWTDHIFAIINDIICLNFF